jgi:hypothetical protein
MSKKISQLESIVSANLLSTDLMVVARGSNQTNYKITLDQLDSRWGLASQYVPYQNAIADVNLGNNNFRVAGQMISTDYALSRLSLDGGYAQSPNSMAAGIGAVTGKRWQAQFYNDTTRTIQIGPGNFTSIFQAGDIIFGFDNEVTNNFFTGTVQSSSFNGNTQIVLTTDPFGSYVEDIWFINASRTNTEGEYSLSLGYKGHVGEDYSVAILNSSVISQNSVAILNSIIQGSSPNSVAIKGFVNPGSPGSIVIGGSSNGTDVIVIGDSSIGNNTGCKILGSALVGISQYSFMFGYILVSLGDWTTNIGFNNVILGNYSFILGYGLTTHSYGEHAAGSWNESYSPASQTSWVSSDRLWQLGNGFDNDNRSNAVTVLKDGRIGINTSLPEECAWLHISGEQKNGVFRGFLTPRMSSAEADAIPNKIQGLQVYDTDIKKLKVWTGAWEDLH